MREYKSYSEFWPHYLREHSQAATRAWHYVGTGLALFVLATAIATQNWLVLLGMPVAGYFFAWVSHAFVERNKPATFTYPLWSLMSDFKMFFLWALQRLEPELKRAGVR